MESLKSEVALAYSRRQPLLFIAAGTMLLSVILDFAERHDYVKLISGLSLATAFALIATWGSRPIGYRKVVLWTLLIVAVALLVARKLLK